MHDSQAISLAPSARLGRKYDLGADNQTPCHCTHRQPEHMTSLLTAHYFPTGVHTSSPGDLYQRIEARDAPLRSPPATRCVAPMVRWKQAK